MASQSSGLDIQDLTSRTESKVAASSNPNDTLEATIEAVELYLRALKLETDPEKRKILDSACKKHLGRAERLRASRLQDARTRSPTPRESLVSDAKTRPQRHVSKRLLSTREKIILLEGSKLNGFTFPPWEKPPEREEFELMDGQKPFVDTSTLKLSPLQEQFFAGWKRPAEAMAHVGGMFQHEVDLTPTMSRKKKADLVQDITSDCSVVASLCAGSARAERGHQKLISSIIFPYDHEIDQPVLSCNGKYILRLHFNGCDRKVVIDDHLPTSSTSRVLHVVDRTNPGYLLPALIEKAYLKARGGYDFPGSNSGTDLAILLGWIPEQIFLHDDDVVPDAIWKRIFNAFVLYGDVLITIGTGKLTSREEKDLGLAGEHDYVILDMQECDGIREMLIKNPWSDGTVWKGRSRSSVSLTSEHQSKHNLSQPSKSMEPGTFLMDFDNIFQHFENLYLNWNPKLFTHREDFHFSWDLSATNNNSGCFINNPQFSIFSIPGGSVWLLLNKHFQDGDYSSNEACGFISLYLFDAGGKQIFLSDGALKRGPFVDSPNTLLKTELEPRKRYTIVIASQMIPIGKRNFTLSALSRGGLSLQEADPRYVSHASRNAAWTRNNAGGNSDHRSYTTNPQFYLTLHYPASIAILLEVPQPSQESPAVHTRVYFAPSQRRLARLRGNDMLASSGDYRRQSAVLETHLDAGNYTIICSTFMPEQFEKFHLSVYSDASGLHLTALPPEDAGRHSVKTEVAILSRGSDLLCAPLLLNRVTKANFIARHLRKRNIAGQVEHRSSTSNPLRLSLEQGQGPYRLTIASSEEDEHENVVTSDMPRIEDIVLSPNLTAAEKGGLWLILERIGGGSTSSHPDDSVEVEILCEERLETGAWRPIPR
ncbi:MAG: hypothetical protein Q9227_007303 [Pyrenula ochraceoflavens]